MAFFKLLSQHFLIVSVENCKHFVRFEVLTAASMKMTVFWFAAPRSLVEIYRLFRGACCLHHQGDHPTRLHCATTQKTAIYKHFSLDRISPGPDSNSGSPKYEVGVINTIP
jgi:hypothetical protein